MRQAFDTVVQQRSSHVFIPLPFDPQAVWGEKTRHHVAGAVNGVRIRGPLGREGDQFVLPLGAAWLRDSGVEPGTAVTVVLEPEGPQQTTLAPDIGEALASDPTAGEFFYALATFYRKGYLRWIEGARKPETRRARIAEMIELLKAGKKQR